MYHLKLLFLWSRILFFIMSGHEQDNSLIHAFDAIEHYKIMKKFKSSTLHPLVTLYFCVFFEEYLWEFGFLCCEVPVRVFLCVCTRCLKKLRLKKIDRGKYYC